MNGRELLEAMSFIEEELLQDDKKPAARRNHWLSLAACLCILVLGSLTFPYWGGRKAADTVMEETAAAMGSNEAFSEFADAAPRAECPPVTDLNTYGPLLTDLGINLLRHSFRGEENVLISPLSVMNALAMTANGADTETLAQMEAVLGGENRILNDYIYNYQRLLRENADGTLHTANSIWFSNKPSLQIRKEFLQTNTDYFGAEIFQTTFNESTAAQVNQWVSENTDGMIPQILEDVPSDAIMYLVNALAFDANWQTQYQDYQVKEGTFTTESGTVRDVDMMYATEHHYLETPQFTGFSKYYEGRRYAFVALLPKEGVSMEELLLSLSADTVHDALLQPQDVRVNTQMPKFETEYGTELSEVLIAMGMEDAFNSGAADFSRLGNCDEGNIFIGKVLHNTYLSVGELGTRAGAATAVEMVAMGANIQEEIKTVVLDRPFVYMIVDWEYRQPLFLGAMMDPV